MKTFMLILSLLCLSYTTIADPLNNPAYFHKGDTAAIKKNMDPIRYNNYFLADSINSHLNLIQTAHGKQGIADKQDHIIIKPIYDSIQTENNYYIAKKSHEVSFLKSNGKPLFKRKFLTATPFHHGFSIVSFKNKQGKQAYNYINRHGTLLLKKSIINTGLTTKPQMNNFHDGLSMVQGDKRNYVDTHGKYICKQNLDYDDSNQDNNFHSGYAWISLDSESHHYNPYYITKQCKIIDPKKYGFKDVKPFSEGFAAVKKKCGWQYIKAKAHFPFLTNQCFSKASPFKEGYAVVKTKEGTYNFINNKGRLILNEGYEHISSFTNGFAIVKKKGLFNFIDYQGHVLSPLWFYQVTHFNHAGFAQVTLHNKSNFLDKHGHLTNKIWFDDIQSIDDYAPNSYDFSDSSGFGVNDYTYIVNYGSKRPLKDNPNQTLIIGSKTALLNLHRQIVPHSIGNNLAYYFLNRTVLIGGTIKNSILDGHGHLLNKQYSADIDKTFDIYFTNFGYASVFKINNRRANTPSDANFIDSIWPKKEKTLAPKKFNTKNLDSKYSHFNKHHVCLMVNRDNNNPDSPGNFNLLSYKGHLKHLQQNKSIEFTENTYQGKIDNPNFMVIVHKHFIQLIDNSTCQLINHYHYKAFCYAYKKPAIFLEDQKNQWYKLTNHALTVGYNQQAMNICKRDNKDENYGLHSISSGIENSTYLNFSQLITTMTTYIHKI